MIFARHYKHNLRSILLILFFGLAFVSCSNNETMEDTLMPVATITTSVGEIHLELNAEAAPITVKNFIDLEMLDIMREPFFTESSMAS